MTSDKPTFKIQENNHKESDFRLVAQEMHTNWHKNADLLATHRTAIGYFRTWWGNVLKYTSRNSQRQIYHYCNIFKVNAFHSCLLYSHITHTLFFTLRPSCLSRDGHRCCYKLFSSHLQEPAVPSSITTKSHFCHAVNHG